MNELKHPKVLFAEKKRISWMTLLPLSHPNANIWLLQLECVLSGFTPRSVDPAADMGIYHVHLWSGLTRTQHPGERAYLLSSSGVMLCRVLKLKMPKQNLVLNLTRYFWNPKPNQWPFDDANKVPHVIIRHNCTRMIVWCKWACIIPLSPKLGSS